MKGCHCIDTISWSRLLGSSGIKCGAERVRMALPRVLWWERVRGMTTITGMQMALSFRDTALGPAFALLFRMGRGSWLGDTLLSCLQTWASSLPWPFGTVKKVQRVKVLAAKNDNLSCIPGTYMVKGKNQPCSLSSACHTSTLACTCEYTQNNKIVKNPL